MPSYTLNNWDGKLSNSHEHTSGQRQEKHRSPSNTIYSRSTPIPAQKKKKLSINGPVNLNNRGDDVRGEGSSELVVRLTFIMSVTNVFHDLTTGGLVQWNSDFPGPVGCRFFVDATEWISWTYCNCCCFVFVDFALTLIERFKPHCL